MQPTALHAIGQGNNQDDLRTLLAKRSHGQSQGNGEIAHHHAVHKRNAIGSAEETSSYKGAQIEVDTIGERQWYQHEHKQARLSQDQRSLQHHGNEDNAEDSQRGKGWEQGLQERFDSAHIPCGPQARSG
jgi:hypothetical protein